MAAPSADERSKATANNKNFMLPGKRMFPTFQKGGKALSLDTLRAIPLMANRARTAGSITSQEEDSVKNKAKKMLDRRTGRKTPSLARAA